MSGANNVQFLWFEKLIIGTLTTMILMLMGAALFLLVMTVFKGHCP